MSEPIDLAAIGQIIHALDMESRESAMAVQGLRDWAEEAATALEALIDGANNPYAIVAVQDLLSRLSHRSHSGDHTGKREETT